MAIYREYSLPLSATITIRKMETTKDINRIKVGGKEANQQMVG